MARGPLPKPNAVRRNAPTITSTVLPAAGRKGRAPNVPKAYDLGAAGTAWWTWAWKLPQATRWDKGSLYTAVRRAQLEDELAALTFDDYVHLEDLLAGADPEAIKRVEWALSTLKRSATGSVTLMKEMRELDGKLGLNPKALADLRWTIEDEPEEKNEAAKGASVTRLRAVDPGAVAS
jgi:hypothetical protein